MKELKQYLDCGLAALPANRSRKCPTVPSWKEYQHRLPTAQEASGWDSQHPEAVCIVCGKVSGNLEVIDFDNHGELFPKWLKPLPQDLYDRLVIEQSPSGGYHVAYRCEEPVCGNIKLATGPRGGKHTTLIETRGEGGLILCAPSPGYVLRRNSWTELPLLTSAERVTLLQAAYDLDEEEHIPAVCGEPAVSSTPAASVEPASGGFAVRPGDDYNTRGDIREVLLAHGWTFLRRTADGNEHWRRPGKSGDQNSATLKDRTFYVFSSNAAPFEPNAAYSPFIVYALLEHNGNYTAAAAELSAKGFGQRLQECSIDFEHLTASGRVSATETQENGVPDGTEIINGLVIHKAIPAEHPVGNLVEVLSGEPPEPERPWRKITTSDVSNALKDTLLGDLTELYGSVTEPLLPLEASLQKAVVTAGCCLTAQATKEELDARYGGGNIASTMLTGACRSRMLINTGGGQLCNVYAMICGNSASGKDIGNLLGKFSHLANTSALPNGQPGIAEDWNIGNAGSAEGLAYALTRKPNGLIQIGELANWIDPNHWQHKATSFLTEAFSSGAFSQAFSERGKGSPVRASDYCAPNIIANIQPEVFDAYVSQIDLDTGFLGRFLFARMPEFYGDPHNFDLLAMLERMKTLTEPFLMKRGVVMFEEGYQKEMKQMFLGNCDPKLNASWRRLISEYYPRFCVMLSLTRNPDTLGNDVVITDDTRARARLLTQWYFAQAEKMLVSIAPNYGHSKDTERLFKRIFEIVRDSDTGDGVLLRTISQNASGTGTTAKQRIEILMELIERRWLRQESNRYKVDAPPPGMEVPRRRKSRKCEAENR